MFGAGLWISCLHSEIILGEDNIMGNRSGIPGQIYELEAINTLNRTLKRQVASMIFADWSKAYLIGTIEEPTGHRGYEMRGIQIIASFYYFDVHMNQIIRGIDEHIKYTSYEESKPILMDLMDTIYRLYAIFRKKERNSNKIWDAVSMELNRTGDFEVSYCYDFKKKYQAELDSRPTDLELLWARDTFRYNPKDGAIFNQLVYRRIPSKNTAKPPMPEMFGGGRINPAFFFD